MENMTRSTKIRLQVILLVASFALLIGVFAASTAGSSASQAQGATSISQQASNMPEPVATALPRFVWICHRTGSTRFPYIPLYIPSRLLPHFLQHGDLYPIPQGGCPRTVPTPIPTQG